MINYCDYKFSKGVGANLCYYDVSKILAKQKNAKGIDFNDLIKRVKHLKNDDVLLANSGPYAWLFHSLRKKYGKGFRIVRDAHTTLWSGYLLQEELCSKYIREGDKIIFSSEFARQTYIKLFEHINKDNSVVCNPAMALFPKKSTKKHKKEGILNLGWVGSVSQEKNFPQAVEVFVNAYKRMGPISFTVCGACKSKNYRAEAIKPWLSKLDIDPTKYRHINNGNPIKHKKVWEVLSKIDILLFPSTANIESNPRVLLEANHAGIPIVASEHGGGYGVVPKNNLVKTTYFGKTGDLITNQPLGRIDINAALEKIENFNKLKINKCPAYKGHDKKLIAILNGKKAKEKPVLDQKTKAFIKNIKLFLNKDYRPDINKAIKILSKNNFYDLSKTPYELVRGLNFRIYAKLNN